MYPLVSSSEKKLTLFSSHLSSSFYQIKVQESRGGFVCAETKITQEIHISVFLVAAAWLTRTEYSLDSCMDSA